MRPLTVNQYVEVPLVARIWPGVPVAPVESCNSPVKLRLEIVADAKYERPDADRFVVDALVNVAFPVTFRVEIVVVARLDVPVTANVPVVVLFTVVRLVKNPVTAVKSVAKRLDDEALVKLAFWEKRLVEVALVVVELTAVSPVKLPLVAEKFVVKKLVVVLFVVELFVATRLVAVALVALKLTIVPDADVRLAILPLEIVVVARLDVPVTANVPVVVLFTVVRLVMNAVTALKSEAKKLVEEALSKFAFVA
jgi:hypothetical protein